MNKNRSRLLTLIFIFSSFLIIFIIKNYLNRLLPKKDNFTLLSIKKETINQLEIRSETKTTLIYKKNPPSGAWYLKKNGVEFRADYDRINTIIDSLLALKKESIISTNKNKHRQLGIDKQSISLITNDKTYQIYIGNSAGLSKTYVRLDQQNEVFVASNLSDLFVPDDFRDLLVHLVNQEDKINYLEIEFDGNKIILEKNKNVWLANLKVAKKERVDFFINDLKTLKASDLLVNATTLPTIPAVLIKLKENNQEKTASFYRQDDNNYFLKTSTTNLTYQIPAAYVVSLKKEEKDFTE